MSKAWNGQHISTYGSFIPCSSGRHQSIERLVVQSELRAQLSRAWQDSQPSVVGSKQDVQDARWGHSQAASCKIPSLTHRNEVTDGWRREVFFCDQIGSCTTRQAQGVRDTVLCPTARLVASYVASLRESMRRALKALATCIQRKSAELNDPKPADD